MSLYSTDNYRVDNTKIDFFEFFYYKYIDGNLDKGLRK